MPEKPKRPEPARTFPESDVWKPPGERGKELEIDHPVFRKARPIAIGLGAIAALGIAIGHPDAPWWMPILAFAVVGAVVYRILRPRLRHPTIEDEI
jgi:hypothetical protein